MKNKKLVGLVSVVFLCMVYVWGCSGPNNLEQKQEPSQTVIPTITQIPATPEIQINEKELSIYSISAETAEKISVIAMIPSDTEITPELIVDKVVESMEDESFTVGIDSVTTNEDMVIVSFTGDQPPVKNVGSSVEAEILDAIAQSLLDNLSDTYNKVVFRVMDGPYMSGHFEFDINHVYMEIQK